MIKINSSQVTPELHRMFARDMPTVVRALAVLGGLNAGKIFTDDPSCPSWGLVQENDDGTLYLGGNFTEASFNEDARREWHLWLEAKYETLERLNEQMGLRHWGQIVTSWKQVPMPMAAPAAHNPALVLDWEPLVAAVLEDLGRGVPRERIAARFHNALVAAAVSVAGTVGEERVALTGGCFQNRLLTERLAAALERAGHRVLLHAQVPPNDGGVSLGQVVVAAAQAGT